MATVSELITDLRRLGGDIPGNSLTQAISIDLMNAAQRFVASELEIFSKEDGLSYTQFNPFVTLPVDFIKILQMRNKHYTRFDFMGTDRDYEKMQDELRPDSVGMPRYMFVQPKPGSNQLEGRLWPTPDAADPSSTISGAHNATVTTISVTSAADFNVPGIFLLNSSEKILALQKDATANQLKRVVRGYADTTAATYAGTEPIKQLQGVIKYLRHPTDFVNTTAGLAVTAEWPNRHKLGMIHYALHLYNIAAGDEKESDRHLLLSGFHQGAIREDFIKRVKEKIGQIRTRSILTSGRPGGLRRW